jgi:hypothetical protein
MVTLFCISLSGCVSESVTNRSGTKLFAVNPGNFSCRGTPDLQLEIEQSGGNASDILCAVGSGVSSCANLGPGGRTTVKRNQLVRWTLKNPSSDVFYVIFDNDRSPAQKDKKRGANIVASENGELCIKINGQADQSDAGVRYRYSVYVKHCEPGPSCEIEVLDPIIYVRR